MEKNIMIENTQEAIFWADAETGLLINCNKAAEDLLGKQKGGIVGHHQTTLHPPEKAEYYANFFKTHIERNGAVNEEAEVITASGKIKPICVTAVLISVDGRSVIQGIFRDITERKRMEGLLRASEARFRRLFESAKDGILILDAETGAITEVNPFLIDMLGYSHEDFRGKKLWEIGLFRDIETSKAAFKELQAKEYIRYEDLPLETRDGRHVDVEFVSNVYWVDQQKVIQCNIRDITERKKVARALQGALDYAENIVSTIREAVLVLSADLKIISANRTFYAVFKTTREETEGRFIYDLDNRQWDIPELRELLEKTLAESKSFNDFEVVCQGPVIGQRTMLLNARKIFREANKTEMILLAMEDITERKKADEEARKIKTSLEEGQAVAHLGSWSFHSATGAMVWSNEMYRIYGFDPAAPVGYEDIVECISAQDREEYKKKFKAILKDGIPYALDHQIITKSGLPRWVHLIVNARINEAGKIYQLYGTVLDVTERKMMEKALRESEERFKRISFHDNLTGLYNRTYFAEEMARLGGDLSRSAPISIISADIDGLKVVNDTLGHKAGDDLLIAASRIISSPFRKVDIIARIGGDEFCAVLPGADYQVALARKKEIAKAIVAYNEKNPAFPISISTGVATSQGGEGENIYDIYQRADEAMYENKMLQTGSSKGGTIDMLLSALAERDYIAQGHVDRLTKMAETAADNMNLSDNDKRNLILLAKVHDLGKVGIPDRILFKSGKLSEEEFAVMQTHSRIGYNIASRSKELFHIANLVLHHHEFWDGNGYADKLKGEQIPLECRIFSIMDAYDAMTNARPYHQGVSKEDAIEELKRCSGTQFEPGLVDQFVASLE